MFSHLISSVVCDIVMMEEMRLLTILAIWLVRKKKFNALAELAVQSGRERGHNTELASTRSNLSAQFTDICAY